MGDFTVRLLTRLADESLKGASLVSSDVNIVLLTFGFANVQKELMFELASHFKALPKFRAKLLS